MIKILRNIRKLKFVQIKKTPPAGSDCKSYQDCRVFQRLPAVQQIFLKIYNILYQVVLCVVVLDLYYILRFSSYCQSTC